MINSKSVSNIPTKNRMKKKTTKKQRGTEILSRNDKQFVGLTAQNNIPMKTERTKRRGTETYLPPWKGQQFMRACALKDWFDEISAKLYKTRHPIYTIVNKWNTLTRVCIATLAFSTATSTVIPLYYMWWKITHPLSYLHPSATSFSAGLPVSPLLPHSIDYKRRTFVAWYYLKAMYVINLHL